MCFTNVDSKSKKNRNTPQALSHSASNLLRRSFGRLPFAFSNQSGNNVPLTPYDSRNRSAPQDENVEIDQNMLDQSKLETKGGGGLLQVRKT